MSADLEHSSEPDWARQRPIVELLRLAGPTVAQMASYTVMQFIDTWMLAHLGVDAPTAAGNAGLFAFAVISFGMGVLFIVNTLVSQAFGQGNYANCGRYLWQGIWLSLVFAVIVFFATPFVDHIFSASGHSPALAEMETTYLKIVLGATLIKMIATACEQFLLAVNRAGLVLIAAVGGVSVNALAAWALIFGHLGFRSMGVAGAAWAQNVGVLVEMSLVVAFVFWPRMCQKYNPLDWRFRWPEFRTLVAVGAPAGLQIVADVVAWSLFIVLVMAPLGNHAMAANTFMFRYMSVSFMPAFGIGQAVTALVGRYIGHGRPDIAVQRAHLGFKVAAVYMLACGVAFFVARNPLMTVFTDDPDVIRIGATLMIFAAIYQFFDAMYIVYNGALRGAGDTFAPAIATAVLCWSITVGGGYVISRWFPQFGPAGPWTAATIYGVILGVFMVTRFVRGKWQSIHLEPSASNESLASATVTVSSI
ncbi:MAG TPA: MATE family efflux transporter [Tepidisphaeraceae bacterium]|nr:MATE family efflux transporter [Tepidisphaeraceae bacterium]